MYRSFSSSDFENKIQAATDDTEQHDGAMPLDIDPSRSPRTAKRPRLSVEERGGFLYYSDRVPRVEADIPAGVRLTPDVAEPAPSSARRGQARAASEQRPGTDTDLVDEEHPISFLIREAERKWTEMVNRQSKTLAEAVHEYRARYGRAPPKGFDDWWRYAKLRSVVLLDEYDQINSDIEPFLAVEAKELKAQVQSIIKDGGGCMGVNSIWAIEINQGVANISRMPEASQHRAFEYLGLISKFSKWLPDMSILYSIEDGPSVLVSGEKKAAYLHTARQGHKLTPKEREEEPHTKGWSFWAAACPPDSLMRESLAGKLAGTLPTGPSFISDHYEAADICDSDGRDAFLHGTTLLSGQQPGKIFPMLSFSKFRLHSDILGTPMDQYQHFTPADREWDQKTNKVLWRGATTGIWHSRETYWRSSQRPRLSSITNDEVGERTVLLADPARGDAMRSFTASKADINEFYFDVAHYPGPVQCANFPGGDDTCGDMQAALPFDPQMMDFDDQASYKYLLDVDGNAWSGRFHRLMATNSLVFKSTLFPEWYSQRVMPWLHYIPIKVDYSDLHHIAAYFLGDAKGFGAHDEVGKRLAAAGKEWAEKHWRVEDMAAYQFRLYLELARAMEGVDNSHDFVLKG